MVATLDQDSLPRISQHLTDILNDPDTAAEVPEVLELREKAGQGKITLANIKAVERRLSEFCEKKLFKEWKKTESRMFIQKEFQKNLVINEKMNSLGIDIGC